MILTVNSDPIITSEIAPTGDNHVAEQGLYFQAQALPTSHLCCNHGRAGSQKRIVDSLPR